ncbi:MAG: hypothetical protein HY664_06075 [Chloroflexi bacterium]|nr:hypothetical protein [Chloroflexota bacterium]
MKKRKKLVLGLWGSVGSAIAFGLILLLIGILVRSLTTSSSGRGQGESSPFYLYAEFLGDTTNLWHARANQPNHKMKLATISHERNFGVKASLAPDSSQLAYLYLPPSSTNPSSGASLGIMKSDGSANQRLFDGVDLRSPPLWSPDSRRLLLRRTTEWETKTKIELLTLDIATRDQKVLISNEAALGINPFAWYGDVIYYSQITPQGTDVIALDEATGNIRMMAHASDGIAQYFHLSPDGTNILYLDQGKKDGTLLNRVVSLSRDGQRQQVIRESQAELYSPLWRPDGLISYAAEARGGEGGLLSQQGAEQPRPLASFPSGRLDVPIAFSSDGNYLATRSFQGTSSKDISDERLVIISISDSRRFEAEASGYAEFIAWLPSP